MTNFQNKWANFVNIATATAAVGSILFLFVCAGSKTNKLIKN